MDNDSNRDFIREMIAISILQKYARGGTSSGEVLAVLLGSQEDKELLRYNVESHPSIKSKITDKDMLLCRIDWALENRDMESFTGLTNELKELELVK